MSASGLEALSNVVGWIYFAAWSASFYGQVYTNWKLKNVEGYKLDFQVLNVTGFSFYSYIYVKCYFFPENDMYNNYGYGNVRIQDLLFALHALVLVLFTGGQCLYYPRGKNRVTQVVWGLLVFYWVSAIFLYFAFGSFGWFSSDADWNFIKMLGYFKLSISCVKYIPPAYWNYTRKTTSGWSIENVVLDFTGGFFSIVQTVIDLIDGTSPVINPIKFTLGNLSMGFDILFALQHFVFYPRSRQTIVGEENEEGTTYNNLRDSDGGYGYRVNQS